VPGATSDQLLAQWTIERDANVADLTVSELGRLLKAKWLTDADYLDRLTRRGYTAADAALLAALATGATPPVATGA
jgi:hypothetical protein